MKAHIGSIQVITGDQCMAHACMGVCYKDHPMWPACIINTFFQDGPTNAAALKRTFGQPESSIRVKLYRDHAAWCPYCQKVWFQLEEKRIPYVLEKINMRCYGDKPASFMAKVSRS